MIIGFAIGIVVLMQSILCFGAITGCNMSLEEKVGQILMVHVSGREANEESRSLIQDTKVGGIIYYNWANGLTSFQQVQNLSQGLQNFAFENPLPIPLLIAVDQEGGIVTRLDKGFTIFPGNKAIAMTGDPGFAEEVAFAMGQELIAAGINMNLAPVVDVNSNPKNPIIGLRSFGEDPQTVITFGQRALEGYKRAKMMTCLKHYPGHGDVEIDSHLDLPVVSKSIEELEKIELLPFFKLGVSSEAVMTAHILMPELDAENCATLSGKTLKYLKDKIDFQGLVISDSLVMEGVLKKCATVDEAALQAFNSGCDILLLGGMVLMGCDTQFELKASDVRRIHKYIVEAVKNGRISEERLNLAVDKILALKQRFLSFESCHAIGSNKIDRTDHQSLAEKIAFKALNVLKRDLSNISPLSEKKISIFAPSFLDSTIINETSLFELGKETDLLFFNAFESSGEEITNLIVEACDADVLLVYSYNTWKCPSQKSLIDSLLELEKPVILAVLRDPMDGELFPKANLVIQTYNPTAVSLEAVCKYLKNL